MLLSELYEKIIFDISEIEKELNAYSSLFKTIEYKKPDLIEMTAIASVLHSFYNGIEGVFLLISKNMDKYIPQSNNSHSELLKRMQQKINNRNPVISQDLFITLQEYLGFRHFFRHNYKFKLDWDLLEGLSIKLQNVWEKFKEEIILFCEQFLKF